MQKDCRAGSRADNFYFALRTLYRVHDLTDDEMREHSHVLEAQVTMKPIQSSSDYMKISNQRHEYDYVVWLKIYIWYAYAKMIIILSC